MLLGSTQKILGEQKSKWNFGIKPAGGKIVIWTRKNSHCGPREKESALSQRNLIMVPRWDSTSNSGIGISTIPGYGNQNPGCY